jgi:hypothetical protein
LGGVYMPGLMEGELGNFTDTTDWQMERIVIA